MKHIINIQMLIIGIALASCNEKQLEPINASKGKPMPVTNVSAEPIPGGATISFVIPKDNDVLSVKAVYTITNGKQREAITSFYGNTLTVEGYNDLNPHEVLLYTISRSKQLSDPVKVTFTPLESPISKAVKTAFITSDFGGAYFAWRNSAKVMLTVEMLAENTKGELQTARIVTSSVDSANFTIRGYEPKPQKFGLIFRDNWDNVSDVILPADGTIIPREEKMLDRQLFSIFKINNIYLQGDVTFTNWEGRDEYMFDGDVETYGHSYSGSLPVSITLDLGKQVRLSRLVLFHRHSGDNADAHYFAWGNPRHYVVYGRREPPATGNWDEWTQLIDFTQEKPSGTNSEYDLITDEDRQYAINGFESSFPQTENTYRYIRFRFLTSWENRPYVHPAEFVFYGEYAD
ncbi:MAG: DUF4959 domain-containing protein [Tannerella sp.]|nr:DUF4959 domain-containing protein [Tannerella sp.]